MFEKYNIWNMRLLNKSQIHAYLPTSLVKYTLYTNNKVRSTFIINLLISVQRLVFHDFKKRIRLIKDRQNSLFPFNKQCTCERCVSVFCQMIASFHWKYIKRIPNQFRFNCFKFYCNGVFFLLFVYLPSKFKYDNAL